MQYRVLPEGVEVDLDKLKADIAKALPAAAVLKASEIKPVAFGLNPLLVCIVRRMKRRHLSLFTLRPYDPTKANPDELRFDVFDDRERITGQLAYKKLGIRFMKTEDSSMSTPWGEGTIRTSKEGVRILLNGRELFLMGGSLLKRGFELTSPTGVKLLFHPIKGKRNDIEYSDDRGYISVVEEQGRFSAPPPGHALQPTKEEIKSR